MNLDIQSPSLTLAIVGTGAMGRGIAQIAAQAGIHVLLYDALPGAAAAARESLVATLTKLSEKGKITAGELAEVKGRLEVADRIEQVAPAQVLIEAIVENLEQKRQLFCQLEDIVLPDCLLATNTSSLSVTAIAAACKNPARVGGMHFFNPVPLMKIVEVIDGLSTAPWVGEALLALGRRMGHSAVRVKDTPGFLVNHGGRGFVTEALRILGEGVAPFHAIDDIMREAAGFRMGPFELMDLTGLDVSQPVMESIYRQFYDEPRFRPSPLAALQVAGGLLGIKTGRGFYTYVERQRQPVTQVPVPLNRPPRVWVSQAIPEWGDVVRDLLASLGANIDMDPFPETDSLCVVTPRGSDATTECLAQGLEAEHTVAIDCLFPLEKRRTVMTTLLTTTAMKDAAHGLFGSDGVPVTLIGDSAGMVAQRIVACVVNVACDIAQQKIALPADIDSAIRLGLAYPKGPLSFGDALGAKNILAILESMQAFYGDPRYRPSPWLKRRAMLGVSLLTAAND